MIGNVQKGVRYANSYLPEKVVIGVIEVTGEAVHTCLNFSIIIKAV
jgi:hypothetical protein